VIAIYPLDRIIIIWMAIDTETATIEEPLPWLVYPASLDLSNTVLADSRGETDLLATVDQLSSWIEAERGRIPAVDAARGRLEDVRALRADVRALLYAHASRQPLPDTARRRINRLSAVSPTYPVLAAAGDAAIRHGSSDRYDIFAAAVARSAVELSRRDETRLCICGAPSCGMLYLRAHPRQRWCSGACGNRARVARHAARRRNPSAS
jgi:predicted RNA-binding Zn ribbon-like protein